MKSSIREQDDVIIVDFAGRATDTDGAIRDLIAQLLDEGHRRIIFNFESLEYLDSTALGELVACQLRTIRAGASLKITNTGQRINDLLTITRLITVFDAYDSVAAATESYAQES
jgi:anti-sigma B factor antagonist